MIKDLALRTREINLANGWEAPSYETFPKHIALVHSEVSEYFDSLEPEELADVAIRLLDIMQALSITIQLSPIYRPDDLNKALLKIHSTLSKALEFYRRSLPFDNLLNIALNQCFELAHQLKIDLTKEISQKLDKNSKRGFRHGGKIC